METGLNQLRSHNRFFRCAVIILFFISASSFSSFAQRNNLTFSCDFEGSTLLSVWPTEVGRITQSSSYSREGSYSARVEVVKGDAMIAGGARSEMNLNPITSVPAEQWFGISYYIPTSWTSDYSQITDILAQWHSQNGTPPIAFGINMASWYVQFKSSGIISLGTVTKGAWTDVVFHMKWSTGSSGLTEIWINGAKVESYSGANFPDTSPGPYFKCGDYKWPWNTGAGEGEPSLVTDRVLYVDAVRVGNASATYADVAPGTVTAAKTTSGPVISLSSAQTITLPTNSLSLTGSVTDATSTLSTTTWSQVSGPNTATIKSSAALTTTVSGLVAGTYVFKLTALDLLKVSASATITVTVNAAPSSSGPVVSAGSNQTITLPASTATLTGSATDASGSITSYLWAQSSGPNTAKIANTIGSTTGISGFIAGTYVFKCTAGDSHGLSASASVTITVNAASSGSSSSGLTASAGSNQTITLPTSTVTLTSSATDKSGTITSYLWAQASGPNTAKIANTIGSSTGVSGLIAGTYVFSLTVNDSKQGLSVNTSVAITVNAASTGSKSSGLTVSAGSNQTITLPTSTTTLTSTATDASGTITAYLWSQASGPNTAKIANNIGSSTGISGLIAGTYVFNLTVNDSKLGLSATASVTITVKAASTNSVQLISGGIDSSRTAEDASAAVNAATNTSETVSAESILLYPNPAQSTISLRLHSESNGNMKVNIFDMTGKLVMIWEMNKTLNLVDKSFNISGLAHGMYTVQVIIGAHKTMVTKFLKQ